MGIERTLEANAAAVSIGAVLLGLTVNRKWLLLPGLVGGFLLQHAVQGWCPPLPFFRRRGVRTQAELSANGMPWNRYARRRKAGISFFVLLDFGQGREMPSARS